jgi:hypothetical protein
MWACCAPRPTMTRHWLAPDNLLVEWVMQEAHAAEADGRAGDRTAGRVAPISRCFAALNAWNQGDAAQRRNTFAAAHGTV